MTPIARSRRRAAASCALFALCLAGPARAEVENCILDAAKTGPDAATLGEIRLACEAQSDAAARRPEPIAQSAIGHRIALERYSRNNPFVLTAHRPNYVMPLTYVRLPQRESDDGLDSDSIELQFQLSQKVLLVEGLIGDQGHVSIAYTNRSFWQAYSDETSAPFRETNHEPELILTFENAWTVLGFRNTANQLILNHQSNGRMGGDSRSWNRIMFNSVFERERFVFSLRPWYRIPEGEKSSPEDMQGDDNPDIERYLGHFEWTGAWMSGENLFGVMLRNNLRSDNRGAVELSWSFPIYRNIKGTVRYFNGYGESLINYNRWSESAGIGVLISDWL